MEAAAADVERFRQLLLHALGLQFDDGKSGALAEILTHHAARSGKPAAAYLDALDGAPHAAFAALAPDLTVTETSFFRNADQMRALEETVIPDRAEARGACRNLRILSAGCASGEEPYSLAIIAGASPYLAGWDVSIQAFDINAAALARAAAARYSSWSLRQTPAAMRERHFRSEGRDFVLDADIRAMVRFSQRNLAQDDAGIWAPGAFDIVFCRNVLMYFSPEAARRAVARIASSLAPGGFLFLGHAETLRGLSNDFHLRHTHGTFYYQRRDAVKTRQGPESPAPAIDWHPPPPDDAWFGAIQRASARIHSLSGQAARRAAPAVLPKRPDLAPALDLLTRERYPEARALLESLPAEAARTPEVQLLQAVLASHGGDLSGATRICMALLADDEMNAGAHYLLALCRESAGDIADAQEHDRIAVYLDPGFSLPRLHLGLLARRAGTRQAARADLKLALSLLEREDPARILLFGGGFGRTALIALCRAELAWCGGET